MPAITQLIPNYTGGVSSQPDEQKTPGQVRDLTNGFTDPTFGLMKRPGLRYFDKFSDTTEDLTNAFWFSIDRDGDEFYIGAITQGKIQIWNAMPDSVGDITKAGVTEQPNSTTVAAYLSEDGVNPTTKEPNYDVLTVQDRTYIVNRQKTVTEAADTTMTLGAVATIRLTKIDDLQPYTVTINGVACTWTGTTAFPDANQDEAATSADTVLTAIKSAIDNNTNASMPTNLVVTKLPTSLELTADTAFTIDSDAGQDGKALEVFQDEVDNIARLPSTCVNNRRIKIVNTVDEKTSYFVVFEAGNGTSGTGIWKEDRGWDTDSGVTKLVNDGLVDTTMPFALTNTTKNAFNIQPITYTKRLVGNKVSNTAPSFVGKKLSRVFVHSNRLGFISEDNVIFSQAGEFENFYFTSAQTVVDSDPIDISCSSLKPARLHSVVTQAQGLVLFSDSEQFVLYAEDGNLTPSDSIIRSISNFQNSMVTEPQEIGNTIYFLNSGQGKMKVYGMAARGQQKVSSTVDISKIAAEYIDGKIDYFKADPQNSMLLMSNRNANDIYMYRFFNNGQRDIMQSWFKWTLPGTIQTYACSSDFYFFVVKAGTEYVLCGAGITKGKNDLNDITVHPRCDFHTPVLGTITYDSTTKKSLIPTPFANQTGLEPVVIYGPEQTRNVVNDINDLDNVYSIPTTATQGGLLLGVTRDLSGNWYVPGDFSATGEDKKLTVGWRFDFDVELPNTYYVNPQSEQSDYTASLIISRYKFSCNVTGEVSFLTKQTGSSDWNSVQPVITADYYNADTMPTVGVKSFTLPLYQRNTNFRTRIVANEPFPFTLNSMMWEGQYSPRFYRRA